MAVTSYAMELESIIIYKFASLIGTVGVVADKVNSLDITPQAQECNIYESIFSPVIRAEIAVYDYIGLFVNWPLTGEEAVFIRYKNVNDGTIKTLYFVVDSITDINTSDSARETGFMLNCVAIEQYANAKQAISQSYIQMTIPQIVRKVYDEYVTAPMKQVYRGYPAQSLAVESVDMTPRTLTIPMLNPFAAMKMLTDLAIDQGTGDGHTFLFFQTSAGFNFCSLQSLFTRTQQVSQEIRGNKYVYYSTEIDSPESKLRNEGRVISNLVINKRLGTIQKISMGYYQNRRVEINIPQKAYHTTDTRTEKVETIYPNKLNTETYTQLAPLEVADEDHRGNRVKFVTVTDREHNEQFPIELMREKWGKDLIATAAMSQVDMYVTIPGSSKFKAGDLFNADISEMHGFNRIKEDDLISGLFVITEVKHILQIGGYHTTVLRVNKDSYSTSVDRASRYK